MQSKQRASLYVAEPGNHAIRKATLRRVVTSGARPPPTGQPERSGAAIPPAAPQAKPRRGPWSADSSVICASIWRRAYSPPFSLPREPSSSDRLGTLPASLNSDLDVLTRVDLWKIRVSMADSVQYDFCRGSFAADLIRDMKAVNALLKVLG